jgi:hypothetical protein
MTKSGNQVQLSQHEKECLLRAVEDIERQYIQLADWSDNWNDANESGWKDSGIWKQKD